MKRFILLTVGVVAMFTSCHKDDTPNPSINPEYKEYLGSTEFASDMEAFTDLAIRLDNAKMDWIRLFSCGYDEGFMQQPEEGVFTYYRRDYHCFHSGLSDIVKSEDQYMAAIKSLIDKGVFSTLTPETRGLGDMVYSIQNFFTGCKERDKKLREKSVNTLSKVPEYFRENDCFDNLDDEYRHGHTSYDSWVKDYAAGRFDADAAAINEIFNYCSIDYAAEAQNEDILPQQVSAEECKELFVDAADIGLSVAKSTPLGPGISLAENIEKRKELNENMDNLTTAEAVQVAGETISSYGISDLITWGKIFGIFTEVKMNDAGNPTADNKSTKIEFEDTDTQTPSQVVVIQDKKTGAITLGVGTGGGKTPIVVPEGGEYTITGIDANGDKWTGDISVDDDGNYDVTGTSNEEEILEDLIINDGEGEKIDGSIGNLPKVWTCVENGSYDWWDFNLDETYTVYWEDEHTITFGKNKTLTWIIIDKREDVYGVETETYTYNLEYNIGEFNDIKIILGSDEEEDLYGYITKETLTIEGESSMDGQYDLIFTPKK